MTANNRTKNLVADQKLIDGVKQFLSQLPSLTLGSQTLAPAAIVQVLQGRIDTGNSVLKAEAARTTAVKADKAERASTTNLVSSLRTVVMGMFNKSPDTLAVFGLAPRKSAKRSSEANAVAAAKNRATRKARNTLGKKKKLLVKGTVPAPPAPAPSPTHP